MMQPPLPYSGATDCLIKMVRHEGVWALYRGKHAASYDNHDNFRHPHLLPQGCPA